MVRRGFQEQSSDYVLTYTISYHSKLNSQHSWGEGEGGLCHPLMSMRILTLLMNTYFHTSAKHYGESGYGLN
jgi:hypothetical protein